MANEDLLAVNQRQRATLAVLRGLLAIGFLIGTLGAAAELLLLRHTEGFFQWIPLGLIGVSLLALAALWLVPSGATLAFFRAIMVLFALSGLIGLYLHLQANIEWVEEDPGLKGWQLLWQALIRGKNPPALAPAAMIQFGFLGLALAFRYPVSGTSK